MKHIKKGQMAQLKGCEEWRLRWVETKLKP